MPLPNDPGREPWEIDHHDLDAVRDCGASGETPIFELEDGRLPLIQAPAPGRRSCGSARWRRWCPAGP